MPDSERVCESCGHPQRLHQNEGCEAPGLGPQNRCCCFPALGLGPGGVAPAVEEQGDGREWMAIWHEGFWALVDGGEHPPQKSERAVCVVPKSLLTTERHRTQVAEGALATLLEWAEHGEGYAPSGIRRTEALAQARSALAASQEET